MVRNRVWFLPAAAATTVDSLSASTITGMFRAFVSQTPSWPLALRPKTQVLPSLVINIVWQPWRPVITWQIFLSATGPKRIGDQRQLNAESGQAFIKPMILHLIVCSSGKSHGYTTFAAEHGELEHFVLLFHFLNMSILFNYMDRVIYVIDGAWTGGLWLSEAEVLPFGPLRRNDMIYVISIIIWTWIEVKSTLTQRVLVLTAFARTVPGNAAGQDNATGNTLHVLE